VRNGDHIAVWIRDDYARILLGAQDREKPSRWVAVGKFQEHESHVGIWITLAHVEERRSDSKRVAWTVKPNLCMLRWESIITIQLGKKGMKDFGFKTLRS